TPFDEKGDIDWAAFDKLVEMQIKAKVTGLVLCGTTGEAPTLSVQEKLSIIRRVKANHAQDIKIMAGTGGNSQYGPHG
ncbi:MAG: 4-hydroxy-tetrahydrodipicolinate synthase, partial [Candidatus Electrothrix sp. LOE1_4_5]|nr:4-hydroxy-tetrahydrodipicolinate synthase [Candidatus Electrothrix gigas]